MTLGTFQAAAPGALFEDKPQSANDAWRKLHSDPLLLIRQREQEALARIKNNPIKMAMIKKSLEAERNNKQEKDKLKEKRRHKEHHHIIKSNKEQHSSKAHSDVEDSGDGEEEKSKRHHLKAKRQEDDKSVDFSRTRRRDRDKSNEDDDEWGIRSDCKTFEQREDGKSKYDKHAATARSDSEDWREDERVGRKSNHSKYESHQHKHNTEEERRNRDHSTSCHHHGSHHEKHLTRVHSDSKRASDVPKHHSSHSSSEHHLNSEVGASDKHGENDRQNQPPSYNRRRGVSKMSEEERAARLREMQADAELHEEQRWKRLKQAAEREMHRRQ